MPSGDSEQWAVGRLQMGDGAEKENSK